jgi:hypothetical protein
LQIAFGASLEYGTGGLSLDKYINMLVPSETFDMDNGLIFIPVPSGNADYEFLNEGDEIEAVRIEE